ncbi:MAG: ankyrin repeat domain-containing protein [Gemmatimonadetes bacterium]|nr:ankyrin repeat domain-containing protein [Gemmatimonadota bacterium]
MKGNAQRTSTWRVDITGALCVVALMSLVAIVPESPVADAAMRGDKEAVRTLLRDGADVNAAHGDGMTALHWAAERGDAEMAEMLIYAGANVRAVTRIGSYTPLHIASKAGSAPVLRLLLEAGSDVNAVTTNSGATALHFAAASGDAATVTVLLDRGADPNARESQWEQTPLVFAAANNRPAAIKALLERGADSELTTKVMDLGVAAAVDRAAARRQKEVMSAFGVTLPNSESFLPPRTEDVQANASQIQAAALAMREIYRAGTRDPAPEGRGGGDDGDNALVTNLGGLTPLLHAARQGYVEATLALLDGGADVNTVSASDGTSPLLMATINGQFDVAMILIERGADANLASTVNGAAPLFATINSYWQPRTRFPQPKEHEQQRATYLDVMEALLKAGANPDARISKHPWYMVYTGCGNRNCGLEDTYGATAFWRAAYGTDVDAMRLLVKYGADPNLATIKPAESQRPVRAEAGGGEVKVDPSGLPPVPVGGPAAFPIHAASGVGYGEGFAGNAHRHVPGGWLPAVKYLIEEMGADVNSRDQNGYTPLHHAAARGDNELILYLLARGADIGAVSRRDQTVADMANGPVSRVTPILPTLRLLEALGSKNNNRCVSC